MDFSPTPLRTEVRLCFSNSCIVIRTVCTSQVLHLILMPAYCMYFPTYTNWPDCSLLLFPSSSPGTESPSISSAHPDRLRSLPLPRCMSGPTAIGIRRSIDLLLQLINLHCLITFKKCGN